MDEFYYFTFYYSTDDTRDESSKPIEGSFYDFEDSPDSCMHVCKLFVTQEEKEMKCN